MGLATAYEKAAVRVPRVHDPGKTLRHARYGVRVAFTTLPQTSGITIHGV